MPNPKAPRVRRAHPGAALSPLLDTPDYQAPLRFPRARLVRAGMSEQDISMWLIEWIEADENGRRLMHDLIVTATDDELGYVQAMLDV